MSGFYPNVDPTYLFKRQGTANDPYIPLVQNIIVKTQRVTLKEIPSYINKVKVSFSNGTALKEVTGATINANQYRVDYSTGMVHFNSAENDKELKFEYLGTGHVNIGANRILLNTSATNNEEVSVQEIIDDQIDLYSKAQESKQLIENNQAAKKSDLAVTNAQLADIAINVKSFGARGDGATDDYSAIQNAIDYCYDNDIFEIYFPKGRYIVSKPLLLKTKEIVGWWNGNASVLKGKSKSNTEIIKNTNNTLSGIHAEVDGVDSPIILFAQTKVGSTGGSATGIQIKNITVRNQSTTIPSYSVTGHACQRMIIDDCNFSSRNKGLYFPGMFSSRIANLLISCKEEAIKVVRASSTANCTSNTFENIYCNGVLNPYTIDSDYTSIDLLFGDACKGTVFNLVGLSLKVGVLGTESPNAQYIVKSNFLSNGGGVEIDSLYLYRQVGDAGLDPGNCAIFKGNGKIKANTIYVLESKQITTNSYIYDGDSIVPSSFQLGSITYYKNFTGIDNPKLLMTKTPSESKATGKFIGDGGMVNLRRNTHMPYLGSRDIALSAQFPFKDKAIYLDNESTTTSSSGEDLSWMKAYNKGDILLYNDPIARNALGAVVTGIGGDMTYVRDNTFARIPILLVGTTAQRPTANVSVGMHYFDTTLGKPIWVKQASPIVWVDGVGVNV